MTKRSSIEILDIASQVAQELCIIDPPNKKAKKTTKKDWFINKKQEFMLTYANTYGILTKFMVEEMLKSKTNIEKYIISIEQCHKTDEHEHIHVYLKMVNKFTTENKRYFDVFNELFTNETKSNHPNIRFKGDPIFGVAKRGEEGTYNMVRYVVKEDKEPIANWDWSAWMEWFELNKKKDTRKVKIPFYDWLHENPVPLQNEVYRRIKNDRNYYQNYLDYFLQINSMIKQDFQEELDVNLIPNFERKFYIPKELKDWIDYYEDWMKVPFERPKGLWLTGESRSAKTSIVKTLGTFNYFPNVWNMDNFKEGKNFNFFDDQDVVFNSLEEFRYFKGFVGSQNVITISGKYKKPKTVTNGIPCVWCSNMTFENQVPDPTTRKFIKDNMVIIELGKYDLKGENYPPKSTINGMFWEEYDPKDSYYYFIKDLDQEKNKENKENSCILLNDSCNNCNNNTPNQVIMEPETSGYLNNSL